MLLNKKFIFITLMIYAIFTGNSFAYLDPISGGIIFQFFAWLFAGIVTWLTIYWKKVKLFFLFLKKKLNKSN
jgi:hypothetical protein